MITETQIQLLHKYNATIKNLKLLIMCNDENLTTKLKVFLTEWCFVNLHFTAIYLKEEVLENLVRNKGFFRSFSNGALCAARSERTASTKYLADRRRLSLKSLRH